jgi:tRNA dimethylallyltransferase
MNMDQNRIRGSITPSAREPATVPAHHDHATAPASTPLLVITGPTAVAKTALAILVAESVPAEIVSADSMAVYKEMDIGTAKPSAEQRRRATFHLIDYVSPDEPYNLARFLADASQAIAHIHTRGHLPILCGGTGLYIRALLRGFALPPTPYHQVSALRQHLAHRLAHHGLQALVAELLARDPNAATQVDLRNPRRVIRALEITILTGLPLAQARGRNEDKPHRYRAEAYLITCPRPLLYQRIDQRVEKMFASGWVDEVRALLDRLQPSATALQAIGYRHIVQHLRGDYTLDHTLRLIQRDTRRFAKRQLTWWRREEDLHCLGWENTVDFRALALALVRAARRLLHDTCQLPQDPPTRP